MKNSHWLRIAVLCIPFLFTLHIARAQDNQPFSLDVPAPKLLGESKDWLNTNGKPITFQRGTVYVVHFWTFGCINCKHNLPSYSRWEKQFAGKNVVFIGVHTPETGEERNPENVVRVAKKLGVNHAILIDNKSQNWNKWGLRYWPTVWLVDKQGHVRYAWEGELEWNHGGGESKMGTRIQDLLKEK